jgi:putative hemolysin
MRVNGALRAAVLLILCGTGFHMVGQTKNAKAVKPVPDPNAAYCTAAGGQVESRRPVYGTNNDESNWLWLAAPKEGFCQFTADDGSRIHITLGALSTSWPTLAVLAYYAQVPWNGQGNGNPASFYCTQLGGAEIGATDFAGGAWVSRGGIDKTLEACVFPDNSIIDSWGLLYHSVNIIRGIDLSTVLKYPNPYTAKKKE